MKKSSIKIFTADLVLPDLEGVPLVYKKPLPLGCVTVLVRVQRDQRVEEGVRVALGLGPQDATQALRLLAARGEVRRDLDDHVHVGQVDGAVADLGDEERVHARVVLERVERQQTLGFGGFPENEGLFEQHGILFERVDVVREDEDFVPALFCVFRDFERASVIFRYFY